MMLPQPQPQEYDTTLKSLFGEEANKIISMLLPGTKLTREKNVELDRSTLKADLVYNVLHKGRPAILNLELQTKAEKYMHLRLLQYHALLHEKYKKPVFTVVLYPFKVRIPPTQISPYQEKCGDTVLLTLQYANIKLWLKDARDFVHAHAIYMYTFLPCMQYASANLLIAAIHEMDRHYAREDLRK